MIFARMDGLRRILALGLSAGLILPAQQVSIAPEKPNARALLRPYLPSTVPPVRANNGPRIAELIRGGTLFLTAQDAVALALENNIDLEISRYNPILSAWRLQRSEAGGALPGVPNAASQAGTAAAGQGVTGSQQAAGVQGGGNAPARGASTNAQITQIGPVTQNLDTVVQQTASWAHITTPQSNTTQSLTTALVDNSRRYATTVQQGTLAGGLFSASFNENYLNENAVSNLLNPSVATTLSVSGQQNFLRGFGKAVNARQITISRLNLETTDLNFKTQVISIVTQVLNTYYGLASSYEDVKARRSTAEVAGQFLKEVRDQINLGAVAPPEEINARRQLVTSNQAVKDAETTLAQQELRLKALISRTGIQDPLLAAARIVPVDKFAMPETDDLPAVADMVQQALKLRADLENDRLREKTSEVSMLGTRNGLLPTAQVFGGMSNAGLAGTPRTVIAGPNVQHPDSYFIGGLPNSLGQIFRRNFPTERIGAVLVAPIGNNQAQADYAIDELQFRQTQLATAKDRNQVAVDVMNYVVALQQARARYDAAVKNRQLQQELYKAEQIKYSLGASTPFNVIQIQRDLTTSEATVSSVLATYLNARIALDQTLGRTLDVNHIQIAQVR